MIELNSTERIQDQINFLNNQMIFDEDRSKKIKKALNDSLPEDAYSVDELVEYKKWYNQAVKNKLQISQTCKDWFEGIFALLIPFGVDYYKTKYRDTSLYNIKPVNFSIDVLKEIAGFVNYFDLDVNIIIYNNLLIRINQKEMTKLKEVNTYTLEELKWYNIWCDKPCIALLPYEQEVFGKVANKLTNKLSEALDEESKTEIDFDLEELTYVKMCANNYYGVNLKTDEDTIVLNKLDDKIHYLKHNDISNSYVDEQEEKWAKNHLNVYDLLEINCFDNWCEHQVVISASLHNKIVDAYGKIAINSTKDVHIQFTLKELKELSNYAKIYHYDAKLSIEEENVLYDLNLRIDYLEKQEKMKNSTENQEEMKCETLYSKKAINQSWKALHTSDTQSAADAINQACKDIVNNISNNISKLVYIVKECYDHKYSVEYKTNNNVTFKGYISHAELVNDITSDMKIERTKLYITFNIPSDDGEDDGTQIINLLEEINLKAIKFENNTLFIQYA